MGHLFEELKRRKIFRIAGMYAVAGWVLGKVAAFAVETFAALQWVQQIFVVFLIQFDSRSSRALVHRVY